MFSWEFLAIVLPWFIGPEQNELYNNTDQKIAPLGNMRGRPLPGGSCRIEHDCWSLTTCVDGKCVEYLKESYTPSYLNEWSTDPDAGCFEDLTLDEAFFYNTLITVVDLRQTVWGNVIVYERTPFVDGWQDYAYYEPYIDSPTSYLQTLTIDEWRKRKNDFIKRIDKLYSTPYWVAFCPM